MAEEVKYNNTLVSGRADETLTYTKYIKDESSGKSTKELLDEKVNKTDQLGTTQIADKAVTTEKLENESVTTDKLNAASVTTDKVADANITTSKLADSSVETEKINNKAVTTDKLNDGAVDNSKLSPEAVTYDKVKDKAIITEKLNDRAVTTEKVEERAITNTKLGNQSVDGRVVREASLENKHFANESVTTEKIKDGSVTNEKVADDTLGIEKFDPELRKTIQAATGLPDDLSQMIQDVDKSVKQLKEKDTDLQSQINDKQQQITANDGDISLLQTRSTQMEKAIKDISASGGASQASAVTYENTESGLDSVTAQGAIDELASKKFNKENIVQEFGDSEDKVVSQSALPFRYIQNEEFIFAKVDAEDKLLFGIQWDGTPKFGKTSEVEDRLQSQVTLLAEKVAIILGDGDTTNVIDTMNELKKFFADIENTETLAGILTNLENVAKNLDKTTIKDEEGNVLDTPFRIIENEEFLQALVDSDNKVLFGFYRATGEPYYPLNEMYHVIQNKEYFAAWLDADDKVVFGIRRDGEIIGEIHAVNALKKVISQLQSDLTSLQEKVGTIDTNLKELLDVFSLQEIPEYMAVEKDADGKVLSATYNDGSHYSHNLKSETIDAKVDKKEGKSLIDSNVADAKRTIEDLEGRTEITTDADDKVMSYRDSQGKKHEHDMQVTNLDVSNINLQGNSVNNIQDALKANGFDIKTPVDWSESSFIQIPEPRFAIINITNIDSMPTTKTQNKKAFLEFWDMQGNYFKKHAILNAQGNSSMMHKKQNTAVDFCEDEWVGDDTTSVKIGNWIVQDSFHLKAFYCSFYKNECPVSYKIWDKMCHTYKFTEDRPYKDYLAGKFPDNGANVTNSNFRQNNAFEARCVPDGFPCAVYLNNTFWGIFSFQLKKHRDNYFMDKESTTNIHLDGNSYVNLFNGIIDWNLMEIRNPKPKKWKLYDMDGNKYDGDSPKELMGKYLSDGETINPNYDENNESHKKSAEVKQNIVALSNYMKDLKVYENAYYEAVKKKLGEEEALATLKREIEKRFGVKWIIDYVLVMCLLQDTDSVNKNTQWTTWGVVNSLLRWNPNPYDMDETFGCDSTIGFTNQMAHETTLGKNTNTPYSYIWKYYLDDMKKRYAELRQKGVFSYNAIFKEYLDWVNRVGSEYYKLEVKKWSESPSNRDSLLNTEWVLIGSNYITFNDSATNWSNAKSYTKGSLIKFERKVYKSIVDNNINHLPTDDNSEWWELVSVQAKTYNAGDTVYDGYSNFFQFKVPDGKSITVTISEDSSRSDKLLNTPFTGFYENYPHEGGRYDSIYRISKWVERKIELMDSQMEYSV